MKNVKNALIYTTQTVKNVQGFTICGRGIVDVRIGALAKGQGRDLL